MQSMVCKNLSLDFYEYAYKASYNTHFILNALFYILNIITILQSYIYLQIESANI